MDSAFTSEAVLFPPSINPKQVFFYFLDALILSYYKGIHSVQNSGRPIFCTTNRGKSTWRLSPPRATPSGPKVWDGPDKKLLHLGCRCFYEWLHLFFVCHLKIIKQLGSKKPSRTQNEATFFINIFRSKRITGSVFLLINIGELALSYVYIYTNCKLHYNTWPFTLLIFRGWRSAFTDSSLLHTKISEYSIGYIA